MVYNALPGRGCGRAPLSAQLCFWAPPCPFLCVSRRTFAPPRRSSRPRAARRPAFLFRRAVRASR
eukprot:9569173-Lingulodinium_polyedra.AAC.1